MDAATVDAHFALLLQDDARARAPLELAWAEAAARGDGLAQWLLSAAALLAINIEFADFRGLASWIARFQQGQARGLAAERPLDRARLDAARLVLPSLDHGFEHGAASTGQAASRLFEALRAGATVQGDEYLLLAKALYDHHSMEDHSASCERVAAFVNEHLRHASVSATWQGRWWLVHAAALDYWGQHAAADAAHAQVVALLRQGAGAAVQYALLLAEMRRALRLNDTGATERLCAEIEQLRAQVRPGSVLRGMYTQAVVLTRRGDHRAALERCDLVLGLCADVEVPARDQGLYREQRAYALAGLHRWDEAIDEFEHMRAHQKGQQALMVDAIQASLRAAAAIERRDAGQHTLALAALEAAAALNWRRFLMPFPRLAAQLAEIGLDAGVQTEFLHVAIRERRLVPAQAQRQDWPWRLRVHALGGLRIERDGELVSTSGKAQRKPLELLGVLAAQGGRPIDSEAVIDLLWPSLEANAPRASLEMALSRLRKLVDLPEAVQVADGMLSLHPALVWTDVAAFEHHADAAAGGDEAAAASAMALYRDRLLGSDELRGPMQAARQRLALRFTRLVLDHGARLEARADWDAACRLYERGLVQDTLAEPIYRALMRAHLQLGERAEAMRIFRRCRELLSSVLGVQPAAETLALAQQAQQGA